MVRGILFKMGLDCNSGPRCANNKEALKVIHIFHSREEGGHFRKETIIGKIIQEGYWWPTLRKDVMQYIRSCECRRGSTGRNKPKAMLIYNTNSVPLLLEVIGKAKNINQ